MLSSTRGGALEGMGGRPEAFVYYYGFMGELRGTDCWLEMEL